MAELINAVLTVDKKSDDKLRKFVKGESERIVAKIRELLDEWTPDPSTLQSSQELATASRSLGDRLRGDSAA